MSSHSPRPWLWALLLLMTVGCKKGCKDGPDPEPDDVVDNTDIPDVGSRLQVVSIDPSTVAARKPFDAYVFGGGFEDGAFVQVGNIDVDSASVVDENTIQISVPALNPGTYDVRVLNSDGTRATLRQGLAVRSALGEDCRHVVVYFDLDKAGLTSVGQNTLNSAVGCYQGSDGAIKIEGHADERGTTDYNLALGQRRADSVKRHLTGQGVSTRRIQTISYGEERPADPGHTEAAWAANRRAEIHASE